MRIVLIVWCVFVCCLSAGATTWYVGGAGRDDASGLTVEKAFGTLQHAADQTRPGDTVLVLDGTYNVAGPAASGDVLLITRPGAPGKWITYKARDGQHPEIVSRGWNAIELGPTAAYIEIAGLTITGNNQNVSREAALARGNGKKPMPDPAYDGNCVSIDGRKGTATVRPNHIRILRNVMGNCGGGGISSIQADYVTISGNTVYNSAWYSIYGCSGISTLESWNSDDSTATKMVITGNRVFNNRELVPWIAQGRITDGEGIIVDTLRSPTLGSYRGRTLIADNVLYGNGSAAIEVFRSDHVDILNNSTNEDVQVPAVSGNGELNLNDVGDVRVGNNIFVSAAGQNPVVIDGHKACGCVLSANVVYGGESKAGGIADREVLRADPRYVSATDLRLRPGSPAVGSAEKASASGADVCGRARPDNGAWDRGAYQR
jgi:hypothetical protein